MEGIDLINKNMMIEVSLPMRIRVKYTSHYKDILFELKNDMMN